MTIQQATVSVDQMLGQINHGIKPEDQYVELKREFIDPYKAARRLGGHANSAAGRDIYWYIGIDEDTGLVGIDARDPNDWLKAVLNHFEGIAPRIASINVAVESKTVLALCISTEAAPYVVKNAHKGTNGQIVDSEVPYRSQTNVRSARQVDLFRMINRLAAAPKMEVVDAYMMLTESQGRPSILVLWADIFVEMMATANNTLTLPFHRVRVTGTIDGPDPMKFDRFNLEGAPHSFSVKASSTEACINGSGMVRLFADLVLAPDHQSIISATEIALNIIFPFIELQDPLSLQIICNKGAWPDHSKLSRYTHTWRFTEYDRDWLNPFDGEAPKPKFYPAQ